MCGKLCHACAQGVEAARSTPYASAFAPSAMGEASRWCDPPLSESLLIRPAAALKPTRARCTAGGSASGTDLVPRIKHMIWHANQAAGAWRRSLIRMFLRLRPRGDTPGMRGCFSNLLSLSRKGNKHGSTHRRLPRSLLSTMAAQGLACRPNGRAIEGACATKLQ